MGYNYGINMNRIPDGGCSEWYTLARNYSKLQQKNTKSQHHKKTSNLRTGVTYGNFRAQRGRFF